MKLNVVIEKGNDGRFDAVLEYSDKITFGLLGQGDTVEDAITDFYNTYNEMKQLYADEGRDFPNDLEFIFKYDIQSFLQFYKGKLTLAGLERITGINQVQLSQYVNGYRRPNRRTTEKIEKRLHVFGNELSKVQFV